MGNFIFYRVGLLMVFSFNSDGGNDSESDSYVSTKLLLSLLSITTTELGNSKPDSYFQES
jgi:hypothetical protein